MKENRDNNHQGQGGSSWKTAAVVAGILAVIQACLTVRGMGIEGFVLWVMILFAGYWLLFMAVRWIWGKVQKRS